MEDAQGLSGWLLVKIISASHFPDNLLKSCALQSQFIIQSLIDDVHCASMIVKHVKSLPIVNYCSCLTVFTVYCK